MEDLSLGQAARAIGVSVDTLRRWDRAGKVETVRDERNQRRVPRSEIERLTSRPERHTAGDGLSARNRFPGVVVSVEVDGVMALVEIEAGPHRITAAITRDAVEELGLVEGARATAAVKATSVMIERGRMRLRRDPAGGEPCSSLAACGGDERGRRPSRSSPSRRRPRSRRRSPSTASSSPTPRCASPSPAPTSSRRRSRRASSPTSSPPPTRSCPMPSTPRGWSRSRPCSPATGSCWRCPPTARRSTRSRISRATA